MNIAEEDRRKIDREKGGMINWRQLVSALFIGIEIERVLLRVALLLPSVRAFAALHADVEALLSSD